MALQPLPVVGDTRFAVRDRFLHDLPARVLNRRDRDDPAADASWERGSSRVSLDEGESGTEPPKEQQGGAVIARPRKSV
jgi:hypothetical protein